jgi:hypothetical protein
MSYSTALGVVPDRRPIELAELRNSHGWSPSIWRRLLVANNYDERWMIDDSGLTALWKAIEELPEWQQAPLVLTFDTWVIPFQFFGWCAEMLVEFDQRLPAPDGHANHVPAMAELLRSEPEVPFFGVYGTSVTNNPFDPWDEEADAPGLGIPLSEMYLLSRHRHVEPSQSGRPKHPEP